MCKVSLFDRTIDPLTFSKFNVLLRCVGATECRRVGVSIGELECAALYQPLASKPAVSQLLSLS